MPKQVVYRRDRAVLQPAFIGRFLSEDPPGFAAGVNFYTYANNKPVNSTNRVGKTLLLTHGCGTNVALGSASLAHNPARA